MRYLGAFVLGLVLLVGPYSIGAGQTAPENSGEKLDGEWELVGFKYGPGPRQTVPANRKEIKLISGTHFVWVVYDTKKQKPISVGGGTCARMGDQYTERLDFGDSRTKGMIGKLQEFHVAIAGQMWQHSGAMTEGLQIEELWKRVE